jgi:uncharacterized protein YcbK (DUF882 family)
VLRADRRLPPVRHVGVVTGFLWRCVYKETGMLGKIAFLIVALTIGLAAGNESQAQRDTSPSIRAAKPAVKTVADGTKTAKKRGKARGTSSKQKPAVARHTTRAPKSGKARQASAQRVQPPRGPTATPKRKVVAKHKARPVKAVQTRTATSRKLRPKARTIHTASRFVRPDRRGGTRYGRMPALPPPSGTGARTLALYNMHTGESLNATYWRNGRYVQTELDRLNRFLGDRRTGDHVQMDPALFDVLWRVRRELRSTAAWRVLSGYRSPETNAWLASVSSGVASDSLHMRGQAIDVMLPGRSAGQIRRAARQLGLGGVGYYPRSGFVHLDTGPVRYW